MRIHCFAILFVTLFAPSAQAQEAIPAKTVEAIKA
jgi:hypothetical protein